MEAGGSGVMESITVNPFSAGLRVMVVDAEHRELENVKSMLQACNYMVTAVDDPKDVLAIVSVRAAEFDMILIELHMPPFEEGLEILKHIKANFDIPVVVMSRDNTFEAAQKCLQNLASFYLRKPLSMKTIRDLWKFIIMEKEAKNKVIGAKRKMQVSQESSPSMGNASSSSSSLEGVKSTKKGKSSDTTAMPAETKVDWTEELHLQFLQAIDTIGFRNAVPSNILEAMKNPTLTRQQVASHLQKYRKYVRKQGQLMNAMVHLTLHANPSSGHDQQPFFGHNQEQQLQTGVQQNFNQLGESFLETNSPEFENQYVPDSLFYLNNQG